MRCGLRLACSRKLKGKRQGRLSVCDVGQHAHGKRGVDGQARLNTRFVCPDCACWIYSLPRDGVVRVRAGTLYDTSWLRPTRHIWTRSKQPWVIFAEGDETFEGKPPD
jgi:hypothetical protein